MLDFVDDGWSMERRGGSGILVSGPPRRVSTGARASRETRNVNRPRSVVRFQRLRLMHLEPVSLPAAAGTRFGATGSRPAPFPDASK